MAAASDGEEAASDGEEAEEEKEQWEREHPARRHRSDIWLALLAPATSGGVGVGGA